MKAPTTEWGLIRKGLASVRQTSAMNLPARSNRPIRALTAADRKTQGVAQKAERVPAEGYSRSIDLNPKGRYGR